MKVGIIGAGSLGTAIGQTVALNVDEVILLLRKEKLKTTIVIFLTIPSSAFRATLTDLKTVIGNNTILVTTAKGIEYPSLKTMGKIIEEYYDNNYVALSGPNFASEIVLNLPTITNIGSNNMDNCKIVKKVLQTDYFKVKIIKDVLGVELSGVIKNINAIANGICEGMNINENARYAVLTKGFKETEDIIKNFGGDISTASEYCGFGDLVLTSTSTESRNHTLGMLYGQRIIVDEKASGIVFEGKNSIMAVKDICTNTNTESVVVDFVYDVIVKQIPPKIAFNRLWSNIE